MFRYDYLARLHATAIFAPMSDGRTRRIAKNLSLLITLLHTMECVGKFNEHVDRIACLLQNSSPRLIP